MQEGYAKYSMHQWWIEEKIGLHVILIYIIDLWTKDLELSAIGENNSQKDVKLARKKVSDTSHMVSNMYICYS